MKGPLPLILTRVGGAISMSEARRYVASDAVKVNGTIISDLTKEVEVTPGDVVAIGKHKEIVVTQEHVNNEQERNHRHDSR